MWSGSGWMYMWLPTRLLELNEPSVGQLRLRETCELLSHPAYVTLSHCWGDAQFFKLTGETHAQLARGIPLSLLAQTFQDTVLVAGRLGVKYLWIDSLCIIQDSLQDWRHESVSMCNVYKGSLFNIAAAASSSSDGGCFRQRDPRLLRPCLPLYSRAWVVQERILAPRVLNFGSQYLFWDCRTCKASEIYPDGLQAVMDGLVPPDNIKADPSIHEDLFDATHHWNQIIIDCSKCFLTKGSDKLVAISGIAKEFKLLGGPGDYLAGLWRNTVLLQMLWHVEPSERVSHVAALHDSQPEQYRAPSWSWASVSEPVWAYASHDNTASVAN
ncbi:heterokaryon incompatibility protein-domain-containing protein [Leptodontidium sp. 2 PMI_412]|nr:heterokaryon incompatibility protein-domain-containing protein [Leptodontidium sp. 2 PMI_412]